MSSTNIQERLSQSTRTSTDARDKSRALAQFDDPRRNTQQATGDTRRHTDADSMRRYFGLAPWDRSAFSFPTVIPNYMEKSWDPPSDEKAGGTDVLATGKPGTGKSTLACYLALRDIEANGSTVVWRGSSSRSEWLALAPWTRLCLPAGVPITARLVSKDPTQTAVELDVADLEEIVREVVRYRDPLELNQDVLKPAQINVVYPDPKMRGCQEIYEESDEKTYDTPNDRGLFAPEDPAGHWWFAWVLARVEHGPHHWTTWTADEIGDIAPQSAQKDAFATYQKIELLKDVWVDARKFGLTINAFGHGETDIHQMIRHKLRWRIQMPGQANPTKASDVVGFRTVPMNTDITSRMSVGEALMYTETNFEPFAWRDMPTPHDYKLMIKVGR
ncbi:ATP-binding protein [Haladaptatus sp. AB618]|uniref:ATP-binding protein n=1 Tax=Haladaptatus sp. AB618 TaxID=2934173 RepID=UPI00209BE04D|nr:ATP-binding protein [Haladaptatus sp. AB618]MCO8254551.1 ATP-binding protein [Haladaptatus sp. AB618]